jgi:hypothetical protein
MLKLSSVLENTFKVISVEGRDEWGITDMSQWMPTSISM